METLRAVIDYLADPLNWEGSTGIRRALWEHAQISVLAVAIALVPALALAIYIGHTRRFEFAVITAANVGRALPSFAILAFFFPIFLNAGWGLGFWPTLVALVLLAIPPILTNAYVGIREVDTDTVESARGMGLTGSQILRRVEIPLAAPLIVAGIRTSTAQVIATATLAALVAWGGLGRIINEGRAFGEFGRPQVFAGTVLVVALVIVAEAILAGVERLVRPRVRSRSRRAGPEVGRMTSGHL